NQARLSEGFNIDPETGEICPSAEDLKNSGSPYLGILPNSQPLSNSGYLVKRFFLQSQARELLPDERVAVCLRKLRPVTKTVDVLYSPEVKKAHYKGLITCARVWLCPVCAANITERRREELTAALSSGLY